jgi:hypothetical protein
MPYAEDFDAAATALDAAARQTEALMTPARTAMGAGVMVGGQLTDMVTDQLDAAAAILVEVTTELTQLAETCRERAEACRQALAAQQEYQASYTDYEADLRSWQEADGAGHAPGRPPEPPTAPQQEPGWVNR